MRIRVYLFIVSLFMPSPWGFSSLMGNVCSSRQARTKLGSLEHLHPYLPSPALLFSIPTCLHAFLEQQALPCSFCVLGRSDTTYMSTTPVPTLVSSHPISQGFLDNREKRRASSLHPMSELGCCCYGRTPESWGLCRRVLYLGLHFWNWTPSPAWLPMRASSFFNSQRKMGGKSGDKNDRYPHFLTTSSQGN